MIDYDPPEVNHPTQIRQALLEGGDINFYRLTIDPSRNGKSRSAAPTMITALWGQNAVP